MTKVRMVGIVALAFGVPETIPSNRYIATVASAKARTLGAPIFTQRDILPSPQGPKTEYVSEDPGQPPPTLRIVRWAVRRAMALGIGELWLVCAEPHLWRAERDLRYAVKEAGASIVVRVCEEVLLAPAGTWFSKESTQPRTRSRSDWNKRELLLRFMPLFVYKKVAA